MEVALIAKNKLGFVLGNCTKPTANSPLAGQWDRCDKMVISWLLNAVIKDIGQSILFSSTARDVWLQLEWRFGKVDSTELFRVQRDLCRICQNNMLVADYFTHIKKLWDDYNSLITIPQCSCGAGRASLVAAHKLILNQQVLQFLVGLNDDYKVARGSILMMKPLPDVDQEYNLILQEEKQRSLTAISQISSGSSTFNVSLQDNNNHSAYAAQQRSYNPSYSQRGASNSAFNQGVTKGNTRYRSNAPFGNQDRRQNFFCDHGKIAGHTVQRCYKLHGYPLDTSYTKERG